jgi:mono/diheme cytochrome c family protein
VARLGCIGCHTLPDKDVAPPDARGRVSWHYVKAKFKPAALVEFLKQPEKHYAWIRMPNFRFTDEEAKQVAAYLLANSVDLPGDAPKGDAGNGQKLVQSAGCMSCHTIKGENQAKAGALAAITKDAWGKGCMAIDDAGRGKAPDFGLTNNQREALLAIASTDRSSLKRDVPTEFAERQIVEVGCLACHTRDALPDAWDESMKELEGLVKGETLDPESGGVAPNAANAKGPLAGEAQPGTGDQSRPPLTWVGEKLKPEWMATFIAGKMDYKPRVWMLGRMPGFPARAEGLATGLAMEHACPSKSPEDKAPDEEFAKIGKQLVSRNGGFSCVQCHGIGAIAPISPFEAPSINFKYTKERIRREYYDRWMRDPTRVVANTKMPKFQNDGKTALNEILDGDADKQFDAIWNYLQAGRKIEHPELTP